jgi:hypothetical protein
VQLSAMLPNNMTFHAVQYLSWLYTAPLSLGVVCFRKDSLPHVAQWMSRSEEYGLGEL